MTQLLDESPASKALDPLSHHIRGIQQALNDPNNRVTVYQQLFWRNIDGLVSPCFPIAKTLIENWDDLITLFLREHTALTPYFCEIPKAFMTFVKDNDLLAFTCLYELMHYEWLELSAEIHQAEVYCQPQLFQSFIEGGQSLSINPTATLAHYQYPVSSIYQNQPIKDIQPEAFYCCVFRDHQHMVQFVQLDEISYQWLQIFIKDAIDVEQGITSLEKYLPALEEAALIQAGLQQIHQWLDCSMLGNY